MADLNSGRAGSSCQLEAQEGLQAEGHSHLLTTLLHGLLGPSHSMVARLQEQRVGVHWHFYDLALEVTEDHFHCTLFIEPAVCKNPVSRKSDRVPNTQWEEYQDHIVRSACGMGDIVVVYLWKIQPYNLS